MCPSAIFGPLSLTTLGSPVCWKVTAVTAAAQPRAALLFSFAKPISMLLGAPRTEFDHFARFVFVRGPHTNKCAQFHFK